MSKRVTWDDQRIFLAVIDTGSLAGAARQLGLAHPTVRARIEALEDALGTVLFTRSAQGLAPTALARSLAGPARAMARGAELFGRVAASPPGGIAGVVRLGVSDFTGVEVVPPLLARLRREHPELRIELVLSNAPADLLGQEVDVAVRHMEPSQGALVMRRLPPVPLGFFASEDYLRRRGHPASRADLAGHDLIGPDRNPSDLALAAELLSGRPLSSLALRTDSHPAQAAAARAGLGIAVLPAPGAEADPRLRRVLPQDTVALLPVHVVMHGNLRAVPRVRVVFDTLVQGLEGAAAAP
ncbi:LysR family transcriptional regulator [Mangrovicoccus sp. HB161399]|uniref:LysR family transcriptional regulator n=1 Tax=Mangrovicoccus sp. HB161399 TaxID=2720392 RepID=UPI0015573BFD|nr:LysR family transcriptional regulator [Mangrovicoccus sp. HB161399]